MFLFMHAEVLLEKLWVGGLFLKATFYSQVQREFTAQVKSRRKNIQRFILPIFLIQVNQGKWKVQVKQVCHILHKKNSRELTLSLGLMWYSQPNKFLKSPYFSFQPSILNPANKKQSPRLQESCWSQGDCLQRAALCVQRGIFEGDTCMAPFLPSSLQRAHSGGSSPEPEHRAWQAMPGCKEYSCALAGRWGLFPSRAVNLSDSQLAIYYKVFFQERKFPSRWIA